MEAETTYHYAINAINPDGTSQQSDTISATTQASPELLVREGETISARQTIITNPAVSTLGDLGTRVNRIETNGRAFATAFITGNAPAGYIIRGARLNVSAGSGTVFTVAVHNNNPTTPINVVDTNTGNPGTILRTLTNPSTVDTNTATTEDLQPPIRSRSHPARDTG